MSARVSTSTSALGALGRHVGDVAHQLAGLGDLLGLDPLHRLGQHHVAELGDLVLGADEDVLGRDVAMDDVLLVGGLERLGDVRADRQREPPVEHLERAELLDELGQRLAVDVLHGEPAGRPLLAGGVEGDQVGVLQADGRGHGADEPLDVLLVAGEVGVQDLEGDVLAVAGVAGLVDRAGAPLASAGPSSKCEKVLPVSTPSSGLSSRAGFCAASRSGRRGCRWCAASAGCRRSGTPRRA